MAAEDALQILQSLSCKEDFHACGVYALCHRPGPAGFCLAGSSPSRRPPLLLLHAPPKFTASARVVDIWQACRDDFVSRGMRQHLAKPFWWCAWRSILAIQRSAGAGQGHGEQMPCANRPHERC